MNRDDSKEAIHSEQKITLVPKPENSNAPHIKGVTTESPAPVTVGHKSQVGGMYYHNCVCMSIVIQPGLNLAFSGVLIPQLAEDPSIEGFDKYAASWIASSVTISQPIGSILVGPFMDWIGRQKTNVLSCVPILAGWGFMYFTTTSLWTVYVGRILCGFGGGMTTVALVYTAEISHLHFRPMLLALNSIAVALGIVLATVLGAYWRWQTAVLFFACLSCLSLIATIFLPESPYWLVNFSKAPENVVKRHVQWLNRSDWLYKEEWKRVQDSRVRTRNCSEDKGSTQSLKNAASKLRILFKRSSLMPFSLLLVLFFLQQASGTYIVIFYTVNIFQSIGMKFKYFDAYTATITLGLLRFAMSFVSAGLSKKIGRKPIMMVSSIGMSLACLAAAFFMRADRVTTVNFGAVNTTLFSDASTPTSVNSWCILVALLTFVCFGALGHMVIPWALMSELLPTKVRGTGSGLLVSYASLLMFVVIKTFPSLFDITELPVIFASYGIMAAISAVFVQLFLPETFRKNFSEIASHFEKNPSR